MKHIITAFILFVFNCQAISQVPANKIKLGAGISFAIPVYNLDMSSAGGGADVLLQYGITNHISITADAGFTGLPGKQNYPSTAIIPIRLGIRYFPVSRLYLGAKAGLGIYTILKASANHAAYSINPGYLVTKKIDASLFYDGYTNKNSSFGYIGIRAGYQF